MSDRGKIVVLSLIAIAALVGVIIEVRVLSGWRVVGSVENGNEVERTERVEVDLAGARERLEAGGELTYDEIEALMLEKASSWGQLWNRRMDAEADAVAFTTKLDKCRLKESVGWIADQFGWSSEQSTTDDNSVDVYMVDPFHGAGKDVRARPEAVVFGLLDQQIAGMKFGQRVMLGGKITWDDGGRGIFLTEATFQLLDDLSEGVGGGVSGLSIELSRGMCFGACPAYSMTIDDSGVVEITGGSSIKSADGEVRLQLGEAELGEIARYIRMADFFSLDDRYEPLVTDGPSHSLHIVLDGKEKSVLSWADGPRRFELLIDRIDQIVGSKDWVRAIGP